jgi:Na+/H+ antiporter NhaA
LAYIVIGGAVWLGLYQGGVHPTLAGVVMGLLAPSVPRHRAELIDIEELPDVSSVEAARVASVTAKESVSVVEWLQHILHPWTSFVIVPIFALANSGIHISADGLRIAAGSAITWGVFFGLVIGKPLGILIATRGAIKFGVADQPEGVSTRQVLGAGSAAGIGFTVAIFITKLAFTDPVEQANAKIAILLASILAAVMSLVLLRSKESAI